MNDNLSVLVLNLKEQKYLFAFAVLSIFTIGSIDNLIEHLESIGDKKGNLGLVKNGHKNDNILESDMDESKLAYYVNSRKTIELFKENPIMNITYLNTLLAGSILTVGDLLDNNQMYGYKKNQKVIRQSISCEIEFMHHVRNGIAHGNKFNYKDEPPFIASFNKFKLSNLQKGIRVIPLGGSGYLEYGDILELYDVIINQITQLIKTE